MNKNDNLSGAGGGLPAGFQIFGNVNLISSKRFITEKLGVGKEINPDVIISGEGKIDEQTFMDKGIGVLIEEFPEARIYLITGKCDKEITSERVKVIELMKYFDTVEQSIERFEEGIILACKEIAYDFLFEQKVD